MVDQTAIVIFAKAPVPGLAKTRLAPALGMNGAAELAARLLRRTLDAALDAKIGPVDLCMTPAPTDIAWQSVAVPPEVRASDQGDGDLGDRMARVARRWLEQGRPVLLIGTDCVEMNAALLLWAHDSLQNADAVIVPAADGGYVLLGLRRFHPSLFQNIPWSTSQVFAKTLDRLNALGWHLEQGMTCHDLDLPEDLVRAPELIRPPHR